MTPARRHRALGIGIVTLSLVSVLLAESAVAFQRTETCREGSDPALDPLACRAGENPIPI